MPNNDLARLIEAADRLAAGGFTMGADWQAVHEICQRHEGEQPFDWGHALCHRIEGDDWNADYWYRRAGKTRGTGTMADEWSAMRVELAAKGLICALTAPTLNAVRGCPNYLLLSCDLTSLSPFSVIR